jgi:hypothetical protein
VLLYNHKQEFIGISEEGLRLLSYSSFNELLSVCTDVADLFANEPGYIHNFKGFGWIDFLLHSDSDASSAIVHANGRVFSCQLSVSPFYLLENPNQNGYSIEMLHIQTISGEDVKSHTISAKAAPKEYTPPPLPKIEETTFTALPDYADLTPKRLSEPGILEVPDLSSSPFDDIDHAYPETISPFKDNTFKPSPFKEPISVAAPVKIEEPIAAPKPQAQPTLKTSRYTALEQEFLDHHHVDKHYVYDPNVAANELGLPVDLIEEFIGDFIQQSYDFEDDLFQSAARNDYNNLHILSHKLKGVAANLRIEDALETLSIINMSSDPVEIEANLKYYFDVIHKLKGGKNLDVDTSSETITPEADLQEKKTAPIDAIPAEDIYSFGLKHYNNETLTVQDHEIKLSESPETLLPKETVFQKEFLEVAAPAAVNESTLDTKISIEQESSFPEIETAQENIAETASPKLEYDSVAVAQSLGIEPDFMDELLFDYKNDSRIISRQIDSAINAFDTASWNESAAKLKGISDNLRLNVISDELTILSKTHDAQEAKKASLRLNAYLDQI